jgi:hypothetical protein
MPPLPSGPDAAWAAGADTALAYAIEGARTGHGHRQLFLDALADLIRAALAPQGGDAAFQALVLRAQDPAVEEHVRLAAQSAADARAVRAAADAIAHPGKLRNIPAGAARDALEQLHQLASEGQWTKLRDAAARLSIDTIVSNPGLARLERGAELLAHPGVQRYRELCERRGPLAGSDAAGASGRNSARLGATAEEATLKAFDEIARWLNARETAARYRALGSLRTPRGFPGAVDKAKDEWDAAIVRSDGDSADIVLLAEVKASPAAATPDFSRLVRGLLRLAHASPQEHYVFASSVGDVRVTGASLRRLQPDAQALPPHVIYCCSAAPEVQPPMLSAATKAVLLAEPASVAFAGQLTRGAAPESGALLPVWDALATAPRLRSALHQYQTATIVRDAMLHPDDLLAAVRAQG